MKHVPQRYKENKFTEVQHEDGFRLVVPCELTDQETDAMQATLHIIAGVLVGGPSHFRLFCERWRQLAEELRNKAQAEIADRGGSITPPKHRF